MIEALQFCNKLAVNAFDIYIIIRLLRLIFKGRLYDKRILYAVMAGTMIVRLFLDYFVQYVWVNFTVSVLLIFMLASCYETQMVKKIAVTVGINIALALSEMAVAMLTGIDSLSFLAKASNGESIKVFLSRMLFWIIVTIVLKLTGRDDSNKLFGKVAVLEVLVFITLVSGPLLLCIEKKESILDSTIQARNIPDISSLIESAVLFTSEITVYLMIYLQDCLVVLFASKQQASLIAQEREYYRREAVIIQQKQELQRQFRHDLKNRLQILNEIAEHGNISELKNYLSEIETKHKEQEMYSNTGSLIIDSIINSKLQDATEKGIKVNASVMLPAAMEVNTDDMVVILGNLLDNAIEACERMDSSQYIKLFMNYEKGCVILSIKNSFDKVTGKDCGEFITTKKDKTLHGIGLKSVKNTVEKYNGMIEFTSEGKEFSAELILYL